MPPEMLCRIFGMIEDHSITSSSSRLSISAVNQRWRKAAHSLRSLWTRLDIIIRMPTYTDGWDTTDKRINHFSSGSVNLFRRHEELTHGAPLYITLILAGKMAMGQPPQASLYALSSTQSSRQWGGGNLSATCRMAPKCQLPSTNSSRCLRYQFWRNYLSTHPTLTLSHPWSWV